MNSIDQLHDKKNYSHLQCRVTSSYLWLPMSALILLIGVIVDISQFFLVKLNSHARKSITQGFIEKTFFFLRKLLRLLQCKENFKLKTFYWKKICMWICLFWFDSSKQILLIFTPNLTLGVTNVCKVSNFWDDLKYFVGVYKGGKM